MRYLKKLDNFEEWVSILLFAGMVFLIFIQVVSRYVFNSSFSWTEELARYMFVFLVYISASLAVKRVRHLRTEFLVQLLPDKIKKWVEIAANIIWLAFVIILIGIIYSMGMQILISGQKSPALDIPIGGLYLLILLSLVLLAVRVLQQIIKQFKQRKTEIQSN